MTAYLVLRLAAEHPEVLGEQVTFSRRADDTPGSTAGVRAGEQLTAGELLYGLLLPSGNDASVALAEQFGSRLAPSNETPGNGPAPDDPLDQFVAAMNRAAAELGMRETSYQNPHGLTAEGHISSARDLLTLTAVAI